MCVCADADAGDDDVWGDARPPRVVCVAGNGAYTLRARPRLPALLAELRAVLLLVVQPLRRTAAPPEGEREREYTAHAEALAALVDPKALWDAVRAGWPAPRTPPTTTPPLDAAALFARIGATLRQHCAPMRDARVDEMVAAGALPGPTAFAAVRMCLELLELMKLVRRLPSPPSSR